MAYFHVKRPQLRGGKKRRAMIRVVGETIEEMRSVKRRWPDQATLNLPERTPRDIRSRSEIMLFVDADRPEILEELESTEITEKYRILLTCMLREQFFRQYVSLNEEDEKWLAARVRGALHLLLSYGEWVDQPESLSLQKLNARLEKFDLGRRSDLKFSSEQSAIQKYDRDRVEPQEEPEEEEEIPDFDAMYRDGDKETRQQLWKDRGWRRPEWLKLGYGEP